MTTLETILSIICVILCISLIIFAIRLNKAYKFTIAQSKLININLKDESNLLYDFEILKETHEKTETSLKQIIENKEIEYKALLKDNQDFQNKLITLTSELDNYEEVEYSLEETATKQDIKDFGKELLTTQIKESITEDLLESFKENIIFEEDSNQGNLEITGKIKIITKLN